MRGWKEIILWKEMVKERVGSCALTVSKRDYRRKGFTVLQGDCQVRRASTVEESGGLFHKKSATWNLCGPKQSSPNDRPRPRGVLASTFNPNRTARLLIYGYKYIMWV